MNLLDTGVIIELIKRKQFSPSAVSSIGLIEVMRGFDDARRPKVRSLLERSFCILDLDGSIIETYCVLYRQLKKKGTLLPDADLLIAATAITHNLILETNDRHFERLESLGLRLK